MNIIKWKKEKPSEQVGSSQSGLGHTAIWTIPIWEICAATYGMVASKTGLLPRTISGSMDLMQLGPVIDVHCPWYHQKQQGCLGSRPQPLTIVLSRDHAAIKAITMQLSGKILTSTSEALGLTLACNHNNSSKKHLKNLIKKRFNLGNRSH